MHPSTERLPGLDLLRAAAVLWVMLFHSFVVGGLGPQWSWLARFGWMGVDLFFVLSGFLIGTQVLAPLARGERLSLADFYWRRAWRILPAYWVTLLLYLAWPAFREAPGLEPAWKFIAFVLNLGIDYGRNAAFSHAWSLCVEEHFYAVFPLLALLLARRASPRGLLLMFAVLVAGGAALRAGLWLRGHEVDPGMAARNWFVEDLYYPTWCRLDGLLCGVALALLKTWRPQAWDRARRHANLAAVAGVAGLALAFQLFDDRVGLLANTLGWPVLSAALALLVFAAAGRDSVIGRRPLPGLGGPAGWLATISFSLYLVHKPAYHLLQQHAGTALQGTGLLAFAAYGLAAVLAGALMHYAAERPGLWLRRRLWRGGAGPLGRPRPGSAGD